MTEPDKTGLSIEQENALAFLILGKTDAEVAAAVGVTRQTVNGWRNHNAEFIAALNRQRAELWEGHRDALRSLAGRAVEVLQASLDSKNPSHRLAAAVHILKAGGLYGVQFAAGPTVAEDIEDRWASAEQLRTLTRSLY
jgi:DNA-binding CsgD family transcriptional regulator